MDVERGSFVWDLEKERVNIHKHGIDFSRASEVFRDPNCRIFLDSRHSWHEDRFFCIGKVEEDVLTVRFTYRENKIRIIGAGI